ncbi:hypothetical protein T02_8087 [Trichinella nativa]|uniref:Uncharacterized protein n=1 Tax=Trichinella nativa TaxID=6335 RepID=A0A0V1LNQ2_9BILA|nr:hypothetical protein T02_8087 [Trichinella nativa]
MEESFRAADALQTEVELDLDSEERQAAIDDWSLCRQNYREGKARARARMVEARNKVYAQKQRQVAQYTGEYTNGRRTLEQFLEALIDKYYK